MLVADPDADPALARALRTARSPATGVIVVRPELSARPTAVVDLHQQIERALGKRNSVAGTVHGNRHNSVLIWLTAEAPAELVCAEAQRLGSDAMCELRALARRADARLWLVATGHRPPGPQADTPRFTAQRLLDLLADADRGGVQSLPRVYRAAHATAAAWYARHSDRAQCAGAHASLLANCLSRAATPAEAEAALSACQLAMLAHGTYLQWQTPTSRRPGEALLSRLSPGTADLLRQYCEPHRISALLCHLACEAAAGHLARLSTADVSGDGRWLRVDGERVRVPDCAAALLDAVRRAARLAHPAARRAPLLVDADGWPLDARRVRVATARVADECGLDISLGPDDEPWGEAWLARRGLATEQSRALR